MAGFSCAMNDCPILRRNCSENLILVHTELTEIAKTCQFGKIAKLARYFVCWHPGKLNYNSHLKLNKASHNLGTGRANPVLFYFKFFKTVF
jgi:hypothetical protein